MLAKTPFMVLHPKYTQSPGTEDYMKSHEAYTACASKTGATCFDGVYFIVQSRLHYKFTSPKPWVSIDMSG